MTERVEVGGLKIAKPLYDLVKNEIAPGTGIDPDAFWQSYDLLADLAPRNRELLATRDALQAQIDDWHRAPGAADQDMAAYRSFLKEIGYLVPEGPAFTGGTAKVSIPRSRTSPVRSWSCR